MSTLTPHWMADTAP